MLVKKYFPAIKLFMKSLLGFFLLIQLLIYLKLEFGRSMQKANSETGQSHQFVEKSLHRIVLKRDLLGNDQILQEDVKLVQNYQSQRKLSDANLLGEIYSKQSKKGKIYAETGQSSDLKDKSHQTPSFTVSTSHPSDVISRSSDNSKILCPDKPPHLVGPMDIILEKTPPTLEEITLENPKVSLGGVYTPDCVSRQSLAVVIPHRARETHLRFLLSHLHPMLQRQQLRYRIFVVHQAGNQVFNKAKLMNAGFLELLKLDSFDCIIFHDVDLLPEDDRLIYSCMDSPKHLSVAIDKYNYQLPYTSLFGGVTVFTFDQFRDVNGFSNNYWGWGGEDDDMFNRVFSRGYLITRPPLELARYKMSHHDRDAGNRENLVRFKVLEESVERIHRDGLNNIEYNLVSKDLQPLYTNITINVGTAVVTCKSFAYDIACSLILFLCDKLSIGCSMLQYNVTHISDITEKNSVTFVGDNKADLPLLR